MLQRKFTFLERLEAILAASRVRDEVDAELGELMLRAIDDDSLWPAVHDRCNVIGRHADADRLRRLMTGD